MDRRRFLITSLAGVLPAPLAGEAQQAAKIARIGYLATNLAARAVLRTRWRRGVPMTPRP